MQKNLLTTTLLSILSLTLSSCSSTTSQSADTLATANHWVSSDITTSTFKLRTYSPYHNKASNLLNIYIEGDGFAWVSRTRPSSDPTPKNPVALKLALATDASNTRYLARPCQYISAQSSCTSKYWTSARYSMEVIQAMNEAIDKILTKAHAKRVNLIGFSGGGTIAMLAALWRSDVNKIITVSANLDHREWSRHHQVSSLTNSLNPADYTDQLSSIEQHHFVGAKDKITPPVLLIKFHNKFLHLKHKSHIYIIDNFTHSCCWEEAWSEILKEAK